MDVNASIYGKSAHYARKLVWLFKYLERHPCVDCGMSDIYCLEFDHLVKREFSPMNANISIDRLNVEIAKCEVRCANCHTKITHIRRQDFRWRYVNGQDLEQAQVDLLNIRHPEAPDLTIDGYWLSPPAERSHKIAV